jgi:hypothetical protein
LSIDSNLAATGIIEILSTIATGISQRSDNRGRYAHFGPIPNSLFLKLSFTLDLY